MNRGFLGVMFFTALSIGAAQAVGGMPLNANGRITTGSPVQTGPGVQTSLPFAAGKINQHAVDGRAAAMIQAFKDSLAKNGVACDATQLRPIGQETVKKRFVVEFQCPQQPNGVVALIPLAGNSSPFEAYDCAGAARFGVTCKLTSRN